MFRSDKSDIKFRTVKVNSFSWLGRRVKSSSDLNTAKSRSGLGNKCVGVGIALRLKGIKEQLTQ